LKLINNIGSKAVENQWGIRTGVWGITQFVRMNAPIHQLSTVFIHQMGDVEKSSLNGNSNFKIIPQIYPPRAVNSWWTAVETLGFKKETGG
jgi:hypothetical protein